MKGVDTAGAKSGELLRLREQHVARGVASATPVFALHAQGCRLWDVEGREFLDFASGIGALNVGHRHPRVLEAVRAHLERFAHVCFQVVMYESYVRVAERLNAIAPGDFTKKSLLVTTGAEAVENAIKIARAYTGRPAVIAFRGGFHGRTLLALSLTGKERPYRAGFGPFAPEVYHAPYPYEYRGWTVDRALGALQELFATEVGPERVAAIIVEPVLGEGGFIPAPPRFLQALRHICNAHGILLVADEIQTGLGRTGRWFAIEHSGIAPDLITIAKSIGGGLPLAAVVGRADVMDAPEPGGLGGTFAGNPIACAAAEAVLRIIDEEGLLRRAEVVGHQLREGLAQLAREFPCVGDVRGLGAMVAMEFVTDPDTKEPDPRMTDRVLREAVERRLLVLKAGVYGNVVRLLPPLTVSDEDISRALDILAESLKAAARGSMAETSP